MATQPLFIKVINSDGAPQYIAFTQASSTAIPVAADQQFHLVAVVDGKEVAATETLAIVQSADHLLITTANNAEVVLLDYATSDGVGFYTLDEYGNPQPLTFDEPITLENGDTLVYAQGDPQLLMELVEASYQEIQTALSQHTADDDDTGFGILGILGAVGAAAGGVAALAGGGSSSGGSSSGGSLSDNSSSNDDDSSDDDSSDDSDSNSGGTTFDVPLTITGNGSDGIITFTFAGEVTDFTIDDVTIKNGRRKDGTADLMQDPENPHIYTLAVEPDAGLPSSNIAVTVNGDETSGGGFTIDGTTYTSTYKNKTSLARAFYNNRDIGVGTGGAGDPDIRKMDTSHVTDMSYMFHAAVNFNQDISDWDVSKVTTMANMFASSDFDQDLGDWDVGQVTDMKDMFTDSFMSMGNMDATLLGWADVNLSAGESDLQHDVILDDLIYSDATAVQYLVDVYGWTMVEESRSADAAYVYGNNDADDTLDQSDATAARTIHGLGGNDTIIGSAYDDIILGGAGDDTLTGGAGADIFRYYFTNAGDDTITDFNVSKDKLDISVLLDGYDEKNSILSDFVTRSDDGTSTTLTIDHDGTGAGGVNAAAAVTILLQDVMIAQDDLASILIV